MFVRFFSHNGISFSCKENEMMKCPESENTHGVLLLSALPRESSPEVSADCADSELMGVGGLAPRGD